MPSQFSFSYLRHMICVFCLSPSIFNLSFVFFLLFFPFQIWALFDPLCLYLTWQKNPESTMTIQWITPLHRTQDEVEYKRVNEDAWQKANGKHLAMPNGFPLWIHRLELTDLQANTAYHFRTGDDAVIYKFKTMPAELVEPIRFIDGGDIYHDGLKVLNEMNMQAAKTNPSFAILGGDLSYAAAMYFTSPKYTWRWIEWLMAWKTHMVTSEGFLIPMVQTIGNHDVTGRDRQLPTEAIEYYTLFNLPGYRVLDFGNYMSIFILDSGHTHPVDGDQTHWLYHALEDKKNVMHKFAIYHIGAYPSVRMYKGAKHEIIRKNWVPIFEQFNLNIAFEHHDHAYKRTHPIKNGLIDPTGVVYMGDGAWGVQNPRIPATPSRLWYLQKSASLQHIQLITISAKERKVEAIDKDGKVFDQYVQYTHVD